MIQAILTYHDGEAERVRRMTAKERVIDIAKAEIGYLEKTSDNDIYDKTANAGKGHYTKYWAEIKPEAQGQPWCACFVTWVFVKAFGIDTAKKLLRHYPYLHCTAIAELFPLNDSPKIGDIVVFNRNDEFVHTGIVTYVNGDFFRTVEGNSADGNAVIINGGEVCEKGYYNSSLPGTKFISLDYSLVNYHE